MTSDNVAGNSIDVRRPTCEKADRVLQSLRWGSADDFPFLLLGPSDRFDVSPTVIGLRLCHADNTSSNVAELKLHLSGHEAREERDRLMRECHGWLQENDVTSVFCVCEQQELSTWLEECGFGRQHTYEVWRTDLRRMQIRIERIWHSLTRNGRAPTALRTDRCRDEYIDSIREIVTEHDLLAAELVTFGSHGFHANSSSVVLDSTGVTGVLLAKVSRASAFDITRAVASSHRERSAVVNILLQRRSVSEWLELGLKVATFVANSTSARETINMACRFDGEFLRREFVHRWTRAVD